ncbi:MAG: endolytic transglycosylase MltG [Paludibacter sp.]|jgi:UPF0755 protein|nr:endolytic transglycosylase MltG [Paludibacter sp.]
MSKKSKNILIAFCLAAIAVIAIGGNAAYSYYRTFYKQNIFVNNEKDSFINIDENITTVDSLLALLSQKVEIRDMKSLKKAVEKLDFKDVKTGHYVFRNGMTNKQLVLKLKQGLQTAVRLTFNNIRLKPQLASRLSAQLMLDSATIITFLNDADLVAPFTGETVLTAFLPDTYEIYWNVSMAQLFERITKEYDKFWTDERRQKAAEIPLSPIEVSILASIVEDETNKDFEYPIIAGLYINRLRKNMLLQACPTVKYAVGDFSLRRILKVHTQHPSPYNTYLNIGLPPGPIRLASKKVIDAVLNYDHNTYIFMAASDSFDGTHKFSTTLKDHNSAAESYQKELNKKKIY